jgi:hypothetical protein
MSHSSLARQQADLVRALVAGAPLPPGFSEPALTAVSAALLRKRAAEVARVWPELARAHGAGWPGSFAAWAKTRPSLGSLHDGWALSREYTNSPTQTAHPQQGTAGIDGVNIPAAPAGPATSGPATSGPATSAAGEAHQPAQDAAALILAARIELAVAEARWHYGSGKARRLPCVRLARSGQQRAVVLQFRGRIKLIVR